MNRGKGQTEIALVIGFVVFALITLAWLGGSYNSFVRMENRLLAMNEDTKNVHASITNNMKSQGLVVAKYGELVEKAIATAVLGRKGAGEAMRLIQEQNPGIDADVFKRLMAVVEASYAKFEEVQRTKLDIVRVYKNELEVVPGSIVAWALGFPRCDLSKVGAIVTSAQTTRDFDKHEMEPVNPFGK